VEAVASADEALQAVRRRDFELAVLDSRLEGTGGLALLCALRREAPETTVVVMTGFATIEGAVEAMRLGAHGYLRKPVEPAALRSACARVLPERVPVPVSVADAAETASFDAIIGSSRGMRDLLDLVRKVAETDSTVLITGETGTGKELIGRALHRASRRRERVFCALNSAAFPETLLESELFGHRRGAFTGASQNKRGLLESAHEGTVFLDEVAEMPLSMQAKLLRFLQTGEIRPVGGETTRLVDVRLVTATNKDLEREVRAGRFREDLFYRLAVIPVHVPPLRERAEDVPRLALHFLRRFATKLGKAVDGIEADTIDLLSGFAWPGNVRELENTIERGVALCRGTRLGPLDLPDRLRAPVRPAAERESLQSLELLERRHILATLERVGWNRKRAAEILQISTTTLWRRLKGFGIESPRSLALGTDLGPPGL
jgi:DNA-binding NtrC family response regulator